MTEESENKYLIADGFWGKEKRYKVNYRLMWSDTWTMLQAIQKHAVMSDAIALAGLAGLCAYMNDRAEDQER